MERMQDLVEKLQAKIKTYKRQVEEAEETDAMNLANTARCSTSSKAGERADVAEGHTTMWLPSLSPTPLKAMFVGPISRL